MNFAQLVTPDGLLLMVGNRQFTIASDHPSLAAIKKAIAEKRYGDIPALADVTVAVRKWLDANKEFSLDASLLMYQGRAFTSAVTDKVLRMMEAGAAPEPLFNFLRKVRLNPSSTAQDELFLFCVANGFMIHEDGDILAYKSVRGDYTDIHSGKVSNKVGETIEMERGAVDDNRNNTCSRGYHFAAQQYATTWHHRSDARLLIMKINPRDVVSIPNDYNNQKGRCCKYVVLAELPHKPGEDKLPEKEVYYNSDFGLSDPYDSFNDIECDTDEDFDDEGFDRLCDDDDSCSNCGYFFDDSALNYCPDCGTAVN